MRFRDEVDLDPRAAWVLSPRLSRGMPRAGGFRELLRGAGRHLAGGRAGDLVRVPPLRPPYDESRPVPPRRDPRSRRTTAPRSGAARDRDPATAWTSPLGLTRGVGLVVRLLRRAACRRWCSPWTSSESPLAVPWVCEVGRRRVAEGPARHGLQWVNGAPRAGRQALLVVPLGDRAADEVRLIFQDAGRRWLWPRSSSTAPTRRRSRARGRAAARAPSSRRGPDDWDAAVRLYAEALRLEPHRASHHAALARARWRAGQRRGSTSRASRTAARSW